MPPESPALPHPSATDESLDCPLCSYDLRGLLDDRCPECGHAFDLDAIRQAKRDRSEWMFENAHRRLITSIWKTSFRSLLPLSAFGFWKQLKPSMPIVTLRLRRFALLWMTALVVTCCGLLATTTTRQYIVAHETVYVQYRTTGIDRVTNAPITIQGNVPRYRAILMTNAYTPMDACRGALRGSEELILMPIVVAWPFVTFLAINLFGVTLQRADIRSGHLWRTVVYPLPLLVLMTIGINAAQLIVEDGKLEMRADGGAFLEELGLTRNSFNALVAVAAVSGLHVLGAHLDYLRLRQAFFQAILVHVVTWLCLLATLALVHKLL